MPGGAQAPANERAKKAPGQKLALQGKNEIVQYIIFDIDGTLIQSTDFDSACYKAAILSHADVDFKDDWGEYRHVTDSGILNEIIESHNLTRHKDELVKRIKESFIENTYSHLKEHPVSEVPGARKFIELLKFKPEVGLGVATGGWAETALMKLQSAGFDFGGIVICSANDAMARVDIMKLSLSKSGSERPSNITYFGDASWDKKACSDLSWNFVLVGDGTIHHQKITDFNQSSKALSYSSL
ncbi:MAG: HAD hydrolase-like protein [Pseudomonadales bacterium]|nr:HAD hydrolase-like protein [Pseudomonadales bacterium]